STPTYTLSLHDALPISRKTGQRLPTVSATKPKPVGKMQRCFANCYKRPRTKSLISHSRFRKWNHERGRNRAPQSPHSCSFPAYNCCAWGAVAEIQEAKPSGM